MHFIIDFIILSSIVSNLKCNFHLYILCSSFTFVYFILGRTLAQMEKMRTEYRGALMWMKNISRDFNPDQYNQLEKFRQVQEIVRQKKAKFDVLKIKSIQKIDLLAASRCNMFSHALILYQNAIILFSEKTAKTLNTVASNFQGYQHYNFQVIKELAEPEARRAIDDQVDRRDVGSDDTTFFNADYHDEESLENSGLADGEQSSENTKERSDSLLNFFDETQGSDGKTSSSKASPANIDYLTDVGDTETDTQQMLHDLFDSPIHKPLTAVKSTDYSSSVQQETAIKTWNEGVFLPSHLLDYGVLDWGQSGAPQASNDSLISTSKGNDTNIIAHDMSTDETNDGSVVIPTRNAPLQHPTLRAGAALDKAIDSSREDSCDAGAKERKLDWYKVFQDIDPLADPSNNYFFNKKDENGAC